MPKIASGRDLIDLQLDRFAAMHIDRCRQHLQVAALRHRVAGFGHARADDDLRKQRQLHRWHHRHAVVERDREWQLRCFQALDREDWMALAGSTLWIKLFLSFALGRQAHGNATMLAEASKKKRAEKLRNG